MIETDLLAVNLLASNLFAINLSATKLLALATKLLATKLLATNLLATKLLATIVSLTIRFRFSANLRKKYSGRFGTTWHSKTQTYLALIHASVGHGPWTVR